MTITTLMVKMDKIIHILLIFMATLIILIFMATLIILIFMATLIILILMAILINFFIKKNLVSRSKFLFKQAFKLLNYSFKILILSKS